MPSRRVSPWVLLLPLAGAAAAYARVLHGEFVFDDQVGVAVRDLGGALRSFGVEWLRAGRPLTDLTFALNYRAGRIDPWGYHLVNVLLHLSAAGLVWLFTRTILERAGAARPDGVAVMVAGVFALHPLQSEAVSYVSQRAECLASALALATLLLLLDAESRAGTARGRWESALAVVTFIAALGAKPVAVTTPIAYLLVTAAEPPRLAPVGPSPWAGRLLRIAPLMALEAVYVGATLRALRSNPTAGFAVPAVRWQEYLLTQGRAVLTYLRLVLWPAGQSADWDFPPSHGADAVTVGAWAALLAIGGGAGALYWRTRRSGSEEGAAGRVASVGIGWFFLLLAPTSSFIPILDPLAEHRVYLASWGPMVAVAVGAERLLARARWRGAAIAGMAGAWLALGTSLYERNAVWQSARALWTDVVRKAPANGRAHLSLAEASRREGDLEAALQECELALRDPRRVIGGEAAVLTEFAVVLMDLGRTTDALSVLDRSLALDPRNSGALASRAFAQLRSGDLAAGEESALRALGLNADEAEALRALGAIRLARGDPAGAVEPLERAVRLDPDDVSRQLALGEAYARVGRRREACEAWERARRIGLPAPFDGQLAAKAAQAGCAWAP